MIEGNEWMIVRENCAGGKAGNAGRDMHVYLYDDIRCLEMRSVGKLLI